MPPTLAPSATAATTHCGKRLSRGQARTSGVTRSSTPTAAHALPTSADSAHVTASSTATSVRGPTRLAGRSSADARRASRPCDASARPMANEHSSRYTTGSLMLARLYAARSLGSSAGGSCKSVASGGTASATANGGTASDAHSVAASAHSAAPRRSAVWRNSGAARTTRQTETENNTARGFTTRAPPCGGDGGDGGVGTAASASTSPCRSGACAARMRAGCVSSRPQRRRQHAELRAAVRGCACGSAERADMRVGTAAGAVGSVLRC